MAALRRALGDRGALADLRAGERPVLLVVDQLEELVTSVLPTSKSAIARENFFIVLLVPIEACRGHCRD